MPTIKFNYADRTLNFANKKTLKLFLADIFKQEKTPLTSLNYIFCSDEYLLEINNQFLQHNYYTDIITFSLNEPKQPVEGEIYISLDRVKDNANTNQQPYNIELLRVIFHGCLHLCGYGDKEEEEILVMRQKEDYYINQYLVQ